VHPQPGLPDTPIPTLIPKSAAIERRMAAIDQAFTAIARIESDISLLKERRAGQNAETTR